MLQHRGVDRRGERKVHGGGEHAPHRIDDVVGEHDDAVVVRARSEGDRAIAEVDDGARGSEVVLRGDARALGVGEALRQGGDRDQVSDVLDAGSEGGPGAGETRSVVAAEDGKGHRAGGPGRTVGDGDRERLRGQGSVGELFGGGERVVEGVRERVEGGVDLCRAVAARMAVADRRGDPPVGEQPGRIVGRGRLEIGLRDDCDGHRHARRAVENPARLDDRVGDRSRDDERRRGDEEEVERTRHRDRPRRAGGWDVGDRVGQRRLAEVAIAVDGETAVRIDGHGRCGRSWRNRAQSDDGRVSDDHQIAFRVRVARDEIVRREHDRREIVEVGENGGVPGEEGAVVGTDDRELRGGLGLGVAGVADLHEERIGDRLALLEGVGDDEGVVEGVGEYVGRHRERGGAVGAVLGVGSAAVASAPPVGGEPSGVVTDGRLDVGLGERDHRASQPRSGRAGLDEPRRRRGAGDRGGIVAPLDREGAGALTDRSGAVAHLDDETVRHCLARREGLCRRAGVVEGVGELVRRHGEHGGAVSAALGVGRAACADRPSVGRGEERGVIRRQRTIDVGPGEQDRRIGRTGRACDRLDQRGGRRPGSDGGGVVDGGDRQRLREGRGAEPGERQVETDDPGVRHRIRRGGVVLQGPEQRLDRRRGGGATGQRIGERVRTGRGNGVGPAHAAERERPGRVGRPGGGDGDTSGDRRGDAVGRRAADADAVVHVRRGERHHHRADVFRSADGSDDDPGLHGNLRGPLGVGEGHRGTRRRGELDPDRGAADDDHAMVVLGRGTGQGRTGKRDAADDRRKDLAFVTGAVARAVEHGVDVVARLLDEDTLQERFRRRAGEEVGADEDRGAGRRVRRVSTFVDPHQRRIEHLDPHAQCGKTLRQPRLQLRLARVERRLGGACMAEDGIERGIERLDMADGERRIDARGGEHDVGVVGQRGGRNRDRAERVVRQRETRFEALGDATGVAPTPRVPPRPPLGEGVPEPPRRPQVAHRGEKEASEPKRRASHGRTILMKRDKTMEKRGGDREQPRSGVDVRRLDPRL